MVSTQAVVETKTTAEQSQMRESAESFETFAETEGWVNESRSLAGLASMLFSGKTDAAAAPDQSYAEKVRAADGDTQAVFGRVASDAARAAKELSELDRVASGLLMSGDVQRADLISFESALVTAQKSYRSFSEATGVVEARNQDGLPLAETSLRHLASVIDDARKSADAMAETYASDSKPDVIS